MSSLEPSRMPAWLAPVCEDRSVSHSVSRYPSSATQRAMLGALPLCIARRSTGRASPSISRNTIPGTSVRSTAPCRRAIRRVTRSWYSVSSLVPRITCRTIEAAAMTSVASSASPNDATAIRSGSSSWTANSTSASATSTNRNPIASMYGSRRAAISGGRMALSTPIASAASSAPPGHSRLTPGTIAAPIHTDAAATAQVTTNRESRQRGVSGSQCGRSPYAGSAVMAAAQHELPDLGGDDHGQAGADADQPLVAGELDRVQDALQEPELGGQDDRRGRQQRRHDERAVVERVEAEDRVQLVTRREREREVGDRERRQRHRPGEILAVGVLGAGCDRERRGRHDDARDDEPVGVVALEDRLLGLARAALHDAFAGFAVAQADRLEDLRREVDPQRLCRQERDAGHDVEHARPEEGQDHPGQRAHLEPDVLDEVVVQAAAELDGPDDRGEVVVGDDHRRGFLGDLRAGDPHRDADVGALERGRVVDAVAGHADDVTLAL